jgi:Pyruvate/2-oxoacid:ferredoxin oxidoreductase delta subunit
LNSSFQALKPSSPQALKPSVEKAEGTKCERCWRYVPAVDEKGLCPRCNDALAEPVSL